MKICTICIEKLFLRDDGVRGVQGYREIDALHGRRLLDFICVRRLRLLAVYPGLLWDMCSPDPPELQNLPPRARGPGVGPAGQLFISSAIL